MVSREPKSSFFRDGQKIDLIKKVRKLRTESRPHAILGTGLADCADSAEALELARSPEGAADLLNDD